MAPQPSKPAILAPHSPAADAPPLPTDAARDGKELIVQRGADISHACFCCNQPTAARITRNLRCSKSGIFHRGAGSSGGSLLFILDVIEFILFIAFVLIDIPASRKRKLTYGLCAKHLKQRRRMTLGFPLLLALGLAAWVFVFADINAPVYFGLPAAIIGSLTLLGAAFVYFSRPGPTLAGENPKYLWLAHAGEPFLKNFPEQKKPKPKT
jgi:hypothetical protein